MSKFLQLSKSGVIGIAAFILLSTALPLVDPDYFWHLKTGEYIVAHGALPAGDVFSFTRLGQPWVLHEWLFEVLVYAIHAAFGDNGVRCMTAAFAVGTLALAFTTARRLAGSAIAAWIPLMIGTVAFVGTISPRPQLLTYLCFALYLSVLLAFKYAGTVRPLFLLPPLMVVWVNAHAGYAVGVALLLLFAACEWLLWALRARDPAQKRRLLRLTGVVALVLLASLVNPGMFERWLYPFQVLGMAVNAILQEWQSPDFHLVRARAYLALALLFLVSWTYAARKPDLTELALPLFFAVQGFIAVRHVPLAVLALLPFTALALANGPLAALEAVMRRLAPVQAYLARRGAGGVGRDLGARESVLNWVMAGAVILCLPPYMRSLQAQSGPQARLAALPRGAADFIAARGIGGKLFNRYADGGYLLYRLAPHARVVVDGRADVYGDRFITDYMRIYDGAADWKEKFERLDIDLAVLPHDAPIRQLLLAHARFREIYRDQRYSVLQRATPRAAS